MSQEKYEITVSYTKQIIDEALKCLWRRRTFKIADIVVSLILVVACGYEVIGRRANAKWAVFVYGIVFCLLLARRWFGCWRLRTAMQNHFMVMPNGKFKFSFEYDLMKVSSMGGERTWYWKDVRDVWITPRLFIFWFVNNRFDILPTSEMDEKTRTFILARIGRLRS